MNGIIRAAVYAALALIVPQALAQLPADQLADAAREGVVVVYGTTDYRVAQPLIDEFETLHPGVRVEYHEMNSVELYHRIVTEADTNEGADVTWSSAMDLQVKLVNDGYAQPHRSGETAALPSWAVWKNEAFGTTFEPIAVVYNKRLLASSEVPKNHAELTRLLLEHPDRFRGRVATYDPERSGLGFLLHTQDVQTNPGVFWALARALGASGVRTHAHTSVMLEQIASGAALIGYNMVGSYALTKAGIDPAIGVVLPADYTLVMTRVTFITRHARHPNAARLWVDFVLSHRGQSLLADHDGLFSVRNDLAGDGAAAELRTRLGGAARPITIGPGLLAYLDQAKRREFLRQWNAAMQAK